MYVVKNEYEALVKKYHTSLYRLLFTYCGNRPDAEDVLQTAYLKLLCSKKVFLSEEHAKNWLYKVAVNCAKDLRRNKWNQTEALDETLPFEEEWQLPLYESIRGLDEKYRMVILLYYYAGYSVKEIGQMLHVKESTVQTRLQRGREKLRKELED